MTKYRLRNDETLQEGLKRIAVSLSHRLLSDLAVADSDRNVAIHDARKGCKLLRGLLRLIRPAMIADFHTKDDRVRLASARLSTLRDTSVMVKTVQRLLKSRDVPLSRKQKMAIRRIFDKQEGMKCEQPNDGGGQVSYFLSDMQEIVREMFQWSFSSDISLAAKGGFEATYRRCMKLMKVSRNKPTDENLHRWRKHVKYHEHHMRLLGSYWKGNVSKRSSRLARLAELLGDDHDLALIQEKVNARRTSQSTGHRDELSRFGKLISRRRIRLQTRAFKLGMKLFRKRPRTVVNKMKGPW